MLFNLIKKLTLPPPFLFRNLKVLYGYCCVTAVILLRNHSGAFVIPFYLLSIYIVHNL